MSEWMNEWENDNRIRKRNWVSIDARSLEIVSVFNINPFWIYYPLMHLWCVIFFWLLLLLLLLFDPSLHAASSSSSSLSCSSAGVDAHSCCVVCMCTACQKNFDYIKIHSNQMRKATSIERANTRIEWASKWASEKKDTI